MTSIRTVCVYCGSANSAAPVYKAAAEALGTAIAAHGLGLVYGGGRVGLMGIVADSVLAGGGRVTGIIPEHIQAREVAHTGLSEQFVVPSMHIRKQMMVDRSDGFVVMPGGFGTLDEAFEIITWRQLGLHDRPIVFVDVAGYWGRLFDMIAHAEAEGFVSAHHRRLFAIADRVEEAIPLLLGETEPVQRPVTARM